MDKKIATMTAALGHMTGVERDGCVTRLSDLETERTTFARNAMGAPDSAVIVPGSTRNRQQPQPQLPPPPPPQQQQQPSPIA